MPISMKTAVSMLPIWLSCSATGGRAREPQCTDAPRPTVAANSLDAYPFIDHPEWVACLFMDEGNAECPQDLDGDGTVDAFDLALLLGNWGPCSDPPADCPADLDGDGNVAASDLAILLGSWG